MKKLLTLSLLIASVLTLSGCLHDKKTSKSPAAPATQSTETSANQTTEQKIEKVVAILHQMEEDGMNEVHEVFDDLVFVKEVANNDHENLSDGISKETWLYSAKEDVTVIVCDKINTPAHVFKGTSMTEIELQDAKDLAMQIMEEMGVYEKLQHAAMHIITDPEETPVLVAKSAHYTAGSNQEIAALKGKEKFVIFFYAEWCGTCRSWEKKIKENLSSLPENTNIIKVDYDQEQALKVEYGINKQSTAVFINADGSVAKKVGDPSLDEITTFFQ